MQSADVIVVGGGVIGLSVAWRAARSGLRVMLLERERVGAGTTWHAAGMLAPVSEADPTETALLELGIASARRYPGFIADLRSDTPLDPGYLACGTLLLARDPDEAEALERAIVLRRDLGLGAERLLASRARRLEPALVPSLRLAAQLPADHAVDPRTLVAALADAFSRRGGAIREGTEVVEVLAGAGAVRGVRLASGETLGCGRVVLATGVWSPALGAVDVHPVKGQILRLRDLRGPGLVTRVLRGERCYLVPRGDGRYVLGATSEERGFDRTVTVGGVLELLRECAELVPGIDELELEEASAGLRPATPDHAPVIGPGALDGLVWATGHYRGGVLLAPVTAELVINHLSGVGAPA